MKKIVLALSIVLLFALSARAAEMKIGYVDLNKALNESEEGKKAVKTLEDLFKSKQSVVDEKRTEFNKLNEELQKQSSVLSQDAMKGKIEERDKLGREFQRMIKDAEDEVNKKRADFMDRILKDLSDIIRKTGQEEGYTVIFEKGESGIMYSPETLDITDKVIKKYNETPKAEKKTDKQ